MRGSWLVPAGFLLLALPVAAQLKIGETSSRLSGIISPGYTADFSNVAGSDHTWTIGGTANYSGSFYNPNFLSFDANVFVNQSRANSDYQSISNASGVTAGATIFGGSHFPGSISYSKAYNAEGNYAVPGIANYVTHGNNDTFGVNWSENLPNAPSFSVGFQKGSSQYSVYGTDDQGTNGFHSLSLHSGYSLAGFSMGGYYSDGGGDSLIPEIISGAADTESKSDNSNYGFNLTHKLPLHGSASAAMAHSSWNSAYQGSTSTGSIDLYNAAASLHPFTKVAFSASASYSDNLAGQLVEAVIAAGGVATAVTPSEGTSSVDLMAQASYAPRKNLDTSAYFERRSQSYDGTDDASDTLGGDLSYSRPLLNGYFNASVSMGENSSNASGGDSLSFTTTENYTSEIKGWKTAGSFAYSQNVETLLVTYMNSFYRFSGNAHRRFGLVSVSMGAGGGRTALTSQAGTANSSESANASVGLSKFLTVNGSYSKSSGQALETGSGLVPITVPSPILDSSLISLFGGTSYSMAMASSPMKGLTLSASYGRSNSDTSTGGVASLNASNEFNSQVQYQARKLWFQSGYSRLGQSFSGSGTGPEVVSSLYFGVSRWFNFF
ncbi:MAG: hypothetical protein ABSE46_04470 [Terracidiphilus sp.]|jgi:hypothetical protein